MKVTYANETYDCTKAVRNGNKATLYLTDGGKVESVGVSENAWEKFKLDGGQWETTAQTPSDSERLSALESAMLAMMGGIGNV